jgi:rhodanese-related sulfurtransferase
MKGKNNKGALVVSGAILVVALVAMFGQGGSTHTVISVEETHRRLGVDTSIVLLDVRTPAEYLGESGHLTNAILIPVQELAQRVDELVSYKNREIIVYCRTGNRSGRAAEFLCTRGFSAMNMRGGIVDWNKQSLPVVFGNTK